MLRKFSNSRTLEDNIRLGVLTAFSAGMVNIASLLIFFTFTSNITGHFAVLAAEIVKGNWYQAAVVFSWIFLFFFGSFVSNLIVIHFNQRSTYLAHAMPIVLEIACLLTVGVYGQFFYTETLTETELLLSLMLFAMGLQNGLTASISNFTVKTTHLTGITTDLGILFSMFTRKEFRDNKELRGKAKLLSSICIAYITGAVISGLTYFHMQFKMFYIVSLFLVVVIFYDLYKIRIMRYISTSRNKSRTARRQQKENLAGLKERIPASENVANSW
ncbi:MAG TPA: YoaK family protein [Ferruginibacter sp.]|nr:YoaK family protein [Ferruginibacter sp.]HMP20174.1 YoaK family protein [Ferruginibacter sp.]